MVPNDSLAACYWGKSEDCFRVLMVLMIMSRLKPSEYVVADVAIQEKKTHSYRDKIYSRNVEHKREHGKRSTQWKMKWNDYKLTSLASATWDRLDLNTFSW